MNPLDRIAQLIEENRQLRRSVDELRAQVETARQELAREAGTLAKLAKDKRELLRSVRDLLDFADPDSVPGDITIEKWENAVSTYSRHA